MTPRIVQPFVPTAVFYSLYTHLFLESFFFQKIPVYDATGRYKLINEMKQKRPIMMLKLTRGCVCGEETNPL